MCAVLPGYIMYSSGDAPPLEYWQARQDTMVVIMCIGL